MLSKEVIGRAFFLHERNSRNEKSSNSIDRYDIVEQLRSNGFATLSEDVEDKINKCVGNVELMHDYLHSFLNTLSFSELNRNSENKSKNVINFDAPFAKVFIHCLRNFVASFESDFRDDLFLRQHTIEAFSMWLLTRLISASKYVLYNDLFKSGKTYNEWLSEYLNGELLGKWHEIAVEYPVLIRVLATIFKNCTAAAKEFIARYESDCFRFPEAFGISRDLEVKSIITGLSDPHRGGRTVLKILFINGQSLIYKPKALGTESWFNSFLSESKFSWGIEPLIVLDFGDYGWAQDVGQRENHIQDEKMIGKSAACLWLLNATDMHNENIFVQNQSTRVIDLETLFDSCFDSRGEPIDGIWRRQSITNTLLFITKLFGDSRETNNSGFDCGKEFFTPTPEAEFEFEGDTVRLHIASRSEQPFYASNIEKFYSFNAVDVQDGFRAACRENERKEIAAFVQEAGPNIRLRYVFRDTYFYSRILERIRQPRFMRDGLLMSLDLLQLHLHVPRDSEIASKFHTLVCDEIEQLLGMDVPYFYYEGGGTELYTSSGSINNFFHISGLELALSKIQNVEQCDVNEQCALMDVALRSDKRIPESKIQSNPTSSSGVVEISDEIQRLADIIISSGFYPSNRIGRWLCMLSDVSGDSLRIGSGDLSLFSGSWGNIVALQAVAHSLLSVGRSPSSIELFLEDQALKSRELVTWHSFDFQTLGFSGYGGLFFAYSFLIRSNPDRWEHLLDSVALQQERIEKLIANDRSFDVISGSAGLIIGCEKLIELDAARTHHKLLIELEKKAIFKLMECAEKFGEARIWKVNREVNFLLGYAHGWAGFYTALNLVNQTVRCDVSEFGLFIDAVENYPRELLRRQSGLYDLRDGKISPLNRSWCNGISGLVRGLSWMKRPSPEQLTKQIRELTDKMSQQMGASQSLRFCCGEMGSVDLFIDLSINSNDKPKWDKLNSVTRHLLSVSIHPEKQNTPEIEFPGLYQGICGILYTASRLLCPEIPSLSGDVGFSQERSQYLYTILSNHTH